MDIARLTPLDLELALLAVRYVNGREGATQESVREFLEAPDTLYMVALEQGQPVGALNGYCLVRPDSAGRQFLLYEVDVVETHQQRGIGTELVEALKREVHELGVTSIWVLTDSPGSPGHKLYRKCGFETPTAEDRMYVFNL